MVCMDSELGAHTLLYYAMLYYMKTYHTIMYNTKLGPYQGTIGCILQGERSKTGEPGRQTTV